MAETDYAAIILKDPDSSDGVVFPDLSGYFRAGDTRAEAIVNEQEVVEAYAAALVKDGDSMLDPTPPEYVACEMYVGSIICRVVWVPSATLG